jgi:hypothetical protein
MKFHLEGLSKKQYNVLKQLGPHMQSRGYYLGGGTALAVYFGHRMSADFDWFISTQMGDALLLAQELRNAELEFVTEQTAPGTLHGTIDQIRVTFLEFKYPLLKDPILWDEMNCPLASLEDLACMKLSAIAQRGARKDFCDIYALGTKHFPLKDMLKLYSKKFSIQDRTAILYGLAYFDDAENERMPKMLWDVKWVEIKKTILGWVKKLGK